MLARLIIAVAKILVAMLESDASFVLTCNVQEQVVRWRATEVVQCVAYGVDAVAICRLMKACVIAFHAGVTSKLDE